MKKYIIPFFLVLVVAMTGCKKYAEAPLIQNPAYIRVFNDLPVSVTPLNTGSVSPFLTFIMDPHMDLNGAADTGAIVGDFLGTRELYSLSYPINEGNNSVGHTTYDALGRPVQVYLNPINFEYPGNAHVLTAPPINGFDLSAWAAVPSGKHRIVFVARPQSPIPYNQLAVNIRKQVIIDTVIDLQPGEVYTLESVSRDIDQSQYGLYMRREAFTHQSFEEDKLYVGFVNLTGVAPKKAQYGFSKIFSEKTAIYYTYFQYDDVASTPGSYGTVYVPIPGYNQAYYTTLETRMDTTVPYMALPMLPESDFFVQDTLRTYLTLNGTTGSLPHVVFDLQDATTTGPSFSLNACGDPRNFNQWDLSMGITSYSPNLNLLVNTGSKWKVYSTVNIMEMVYDRVYMMQIQRGFNELPKN